MQLTVGHVQCATNGLPEVIVTSQVNKTDLRHNNCTLRTTGKYCKRLLWLTVTVLCGNLM